MAALPPSAPARHTRPGRHHTNKPLLESFTALLSFLSHVAPRFPAITQPLLPTHLLALLSPPLVHSLPSSLRYQCAGCLILLQNRGMVSRFAVLPVLFALMGVQDKRLRSLCTAHVIADIKRVNKHKHDVKLNSALQNFMYGLLKQTNTASTDPTAAAARTPSTDGTTAKKALDVMVDLYRRRVWTDDKTVNVIVAACFHSNVRVMVTALRFFLGVSFYDEEEEEEEDMDIKQQTTRKQIVAKADHMKGIVKKRKKRQREITRANRAIKRLENKHTIHSDLPPLQLVHDPQSFAERLFSRLRSSSYSFVVRLLLMNVISRLIGEHRLILLNFYSFLQKYMQPHQRHVTVILTYLAQATHSLVPPDTLRPLLLHLTSQFVSDRSSSEVMAVGLNTVRELCSRQPLVMTRSLLADLVQYRRHKVKGVMMAARALLAVYREKMPALLARRERGKGGVVAASEEERRQQAETEAHDELFGQADYSVDVAGAELLRQRETEEKEAAGDDDSWAIGQHEGQEDDEEDEDGEEDEEKEMLTLKEVDEFLKELDGDQLEEDQEEVTTKPPPDEEAELEHELDAELEEASEEDEEAEDVDETAEDEGGDSDGLEVEEEEGDEDDVAEQADDNEDRSQPPRAKRQRVSFSSTISVSEPSAVTDSTDMSTAPSTPALPYAATKIFTPKDFALLRQLQQQQKTANSSAASRKRTKPSAATDDDSSQPSAVVAVDDLKGYQAKRRKSKEERLDSIREGRESMKGGKASKVKGGGSTNAEKLKSKPFMLVKYSGDVQAKQRQAFSVVQKNQQTHITNLKRQGKKAKRKMKAKRGY